MKLYKNVDIKDLQAILREGIQPISVTGNNNWSDGKRASNSEDVVYLFETIKGESNTFPQYGMALLEVEVSTAKENELSERDVNRGNYIEYVIAEVKPEEITAIYIPKIYKKEIELKYQLNDDRIQFVGITAKIFSHSELSPTEENPFNTKIFHRDATFEELALLIREGYTPLNSDEMGYFRGIDADGTVVDYQKINYKI